MTYLIVVVFFLAFPVTLAITDILDHVKHVDDDDDNDDEVYTATSFAPVNSHCCPPVSTLFPVQANALKYLN